MKGQDYAKETGNSEMTHKEVFAGKREQNTVPRENDEQSQGTWF